MINAIVVPAKGASKRFPGKNWMKLGEETLFELALLRAKKSDLGEVIFVSDDDMLSRIKKRVFLADYMIKLPEEFVDKRAVNSCTWALRKLGLEGLKFDNIIVTLPTSPLATYKNLREAYSVFIDRDRQTLGSFTEVKGRPFLWYAPYMTKFDAQLPFQSPFSVARFQHSQILMDNGAVYISRVDRFLKREEWFDDWVIPYFTNEIEGVDIDTELDYIIAKAMYEAKL